MVQVPPFVNIQHLLQPVIYITPVALTLSDPKNIVEFIFFLSDLPTIRPSIFDNRNILNDRYSEITDAFNLKQKSSIFLSIENAFFIYYSFAQVETS